VTPMEEQAPATDEERRRRRRRDFWTLDVPLIVVLAICISATVIEVNRAGAGNWRAAVYAIEWPLIGAFSLWMWFRFRREGGSFRGIARGWQERVARYEAEARARDAEATAAEEASGDPGLAAWREYQAELRDGEQPEGRG
jgi:hypothetical protein